MRELVQLRRMPRMPSASSLERAANCPASHVLPVVHRDAGVAAKRGTTVHAFVVRAGQVGRDAALAEIPIDDPGRQLCAAVPVEQLPKGGHVELAFAYDPTTDRARILGENIERAYREHGLLDHELAGTADVVGLDGDTAVIIDFKTGFHHLGPAARSWQLRFLALCAARAFGVSAARTAFWYLRDSGDVFGFDDTGILDAFDLEQVAADIRDVLARVQAVAAADGVPDVTMGDEWCKWCECKPHCPAFAPLLNKLQKIDSNAELTHDTVARAWEFVERVEPVLEHIKASLKTWARAEPIELPDGRVVSEHIEERETIDADIAFKALEQAMGPEVARAAAERAITKASIGRAIRRVRGNAGAAAATGEAVNAIRQAGGIAVQAISKVQARKL